MRLLCLCGLYLKMPEINFNSPLVVFGAGSIGERHIQILQELGYKNIHVYRQRNLPLRTIEAASVTVFTDIEKLDEINPVAAFITSPTAFHVDQALHCAAKGIHVLVEKPLSNSLDGIDALQSKAVENNILVQVAYMLRYHPAFKQLKKIIETKAYGKLHYYHTHWGEYLPDWHPWEDYRQSYAAKKTLGGGVALTLSHDIDILNWLAGEPPVKCNGIPHTSSSLEVDVEAGVDFICAYPSGTTGHIHLNYFQKTPYRTYLFVFEDAFVQYNYLQSLLTIETKQGSKTIEFKEFQRNDMFREQTKNFLNKLNTLRDFASHSKQQIENSKIIIGMCNKLNN